MRFVATAILLGVAAFGYTFWEAILGFAYQLTTIEFGIAYTLMALAVSSVVAVLGMPAINGVSWKTHATMPVKWHTIPCQAGGPDKQVSDKEDRFCYALLTGCVTMGFFGMGYINASPMFAALALLWVGFIVILAHTRVLASANI